MNSKALARKLYLKLEIDNKNRLTIRYREPFNLLARNHLNGLVPETGLEPAPRN